MLTYVRIATAETVGIDLEPHRKGAEHGKENTCQVCWANTLVDRGAKLHASVGLMHPF